MRQKMVIFDINSLVFGLDISCKLIKNVLTSLDVQFSNKDILKARYGNVSSVSENYIRKNGVELIATNMVVEKSISVINNGLCKHIELRDIIDKPTIKSTMDILKHEGYKIGVSSGFDSIVTDKLINELRFRRYIDSWVTVDKVKYGKPYPYMTYKLMEDCKITSTKNVIAIVTSDIDVKVARNAGCGLVFKDVDLNCFQQEMLAGTDIPFLDTKRLLDL